MIVDYFCMMVHIILIWFNFLKILNDMHNPFIHKCD